MKVFVNKELLPNPPPLPMDFSIVDTMPSIDTEGFYFGTIGECQRASKMGDKNLVTSYWDLQVSDFMPAIKGEYLNYEGSYFKQVCQLDSGDIGKFCRSNSGDKRWSGQVIEGRIDMETIRSRLQEDDMLFLAPSKRLPNHEWRCWVLQDKLIELYCHSFIKSHDTPKDAEKKAVAKYIERINSRWTPDDTFVIDVCKYDGKYKVVEYNCFSTSGHYGADTNGIARKVRELLSAGQRRRTQHV